MRVKHWAWFAVALGVLLFALVIPVHKTKVAGAAPKPATPHIIQAATPAPFEVLSTQCEDKENGFYNCSATVAFKPGDKQYNAVSVQFLLTSEDGKQNTAALATRDRDLSQLDKVFTPGEPIILHTPMFQIANGDTKEPLRIIDIAVQPDSAVDTNGQVWGNKTGFAAKEFLLRRGGLTQDEIMKSMGLHGGAH